MAHFLGTGALDTSFGNGGVRLMSEVGPRNGRSVAMTSDGHVLVMGMTNQNVQIAKLDSKGALDSTFGMGGVTEITSLTASLHTAGETLEARALTVQADGTLLVAVNWTTDVLDAKKPMGVYVLRLDAQGKPDSTFGAGGLTGRLEFDPAVEASSPYQGYVMGQPMLIVGDRLIVGGQATTNYGGFLAIQL